MNQERLNRNQTKSEMAYERAVLALNQIEDIDWNDFVRQVETEDRKRSDKLEGRGQVRLWVEVDEEVDGYD